MNATTMQAQGQNGYELLFPSLFNAGRGYAFPCDAQGNVDLDSLSDRARGNYFFARSVIGRDFGVPAVQRTPPSRVVGALKDWMLRLKPMTNLAGTEG